MQKNRRKILVCTADRAEHGLLEPVMAELKKLVTIEAAWCRLNSKSSPMMNLKCFNLELRRFRPDIILIPTDRNEMVYAAAYASHKGYIIAHFHAGNNPSNHPDDINRHVISTFAHILLCNMPQHKQNLINQGEEEWRCHVVGSTAFDDIEYDSSILPEGPFDLVILHPNPLSADKTREDLAETLGAIRDRKIIWIYPNHDANYDFIEHLLDSFTRVQVTLLPSEQAIIAYKNLPRPQFFSLLKNCTAAIGNSSSFYYELPIINPQAKIIQIGERNKGLIVPVAQVGGAKRIADLLATIELTGQLRNKLR